MTDDPLRHPRGFTRGPFGTNEGDKWTAPGSSVQDQLDADGEGKVLIHEMMVRDGRLQEVLYVAVPTDDMADLIAEAREGAERWVAQQASQN